MTDVPSRVGLILTRKFEETVLGEPGKGSVSRRTKGSEKKQGERERQSVEGVWSEKKKEKRRDERLRKFDTWSQYMHRTPQTQRRR